MAKQPVVEFKSIAKAYNGGLPVLNSFDLSIHEGEFLTLLGPSGCGKTTLLRLLAGFEMPDCGEILIDGKPMNHLPPEGRNVNTVFQSYALFPHLSVFDNVAFGLKMKKFSSADIRERVAEGLDAMHLTEYRDRKPRQLSGGQQQRVALARALVNRPRVLLLDEPLSALDNRLRRAMQVELKSLQRHLGITFVFVTHDQEEALSMSDRVAVMRRGVIEQIGGPREIYEQPANPYVAQFVGESNLLGGVVTRWEGSNRLVALVEGMDYDVPVDSGLAVGDRFFVLLRPEDLHVVECSDRTARLKGRIIEQVYKGVTLDTVLELEHGKQLFVSEFFDQQKQGTDFQIGQRVGVTWAANQEIVLRNDETAN